MVLELTMNNSPKTTPAFPPFGDPNYNPLNVVNPYGNNLIDSSRGMQTFQGPQSNSTMVSDNIEMVKRLRAYVPRASMKEGRVPTGNHLGYEDSPMLDNVGNYKSSYQ